MILIGRFYANVNEKVNENIKVKIWRWLEKAQAGYSKYENSSGMEIMVDIDVCDKAEEMAKVLNTDVEGIFAIAAYRLGRA